jgi:hypothetical protein
MAEREAKTAAFTSPRDFFTPLPMLPAIFPHSKGDLAVEARQCGLGVNGLGLRDLLNANDGSNGPDIGDLRRSGVNLTHIGMGMVRTRTGAPELLLVAVIPMRPGAVPPIGIPMGAVIILVIRWIGVRLGAQGA